MSLSRTLIGASLLTVVAILLLGWHQPVIDQIRQAARRRHTSETVAVTLRGRECMPGRLDIGPRMVDGCTAFSCKVRFSQVGTLAEEGFEASIASDAFTVEMSAYGRPGGEPGIICRIGPGGDPTEGLVFVPCRSDDAQTAEVEVTVCNACREGTPGQARDQMPNDRTFARVSVAGVCRDCRALGPWAEAGWPVTFEMSPVRPSSFRPGLLVEFSKVCFTDIPAELCVAMQTASTGRRDLLLDNTGSGFALAVVK